jgi:hypothetical protein
MYILSMLLGSVIDAPEAFGGHWRASPDMPTLVGSFPVYPIVLDMSLLSDIHSLAVAR